MKSQEILPPESYDWDRLFTNYFLDGRFYLVRPESVIGKIYVGDEKMDLTADTVYRAIKLVERGETGAPTGKTKILLFTQLYPPYTTFHVDQSEITWLNPEDINENTEIIRGSLEDALTNPKARTLFTKADQFIIEHGGNPNYRGEKHIPTKITSLRKQK